MDRPHIHEGHRSGQKGDSLIRVRGGSTMKVATLGIDLAKSVFQLHGVAVHGNVAIQKRVTRSKVRETVAQLPACVIGMEACASAQYWARAFQELGHTVKLISPQFVEP